MKIRAYTEDGASRPFACVDVVFEDGTELQYTVEPNGDYDLWMDKLDEDTRAQVVGAGCAAINARWASSVPTDKEGEGRADV